MKFPILPFVVVLAMGSFTPESSLGFDNQPPTTMVKMVLRDISHYAKNNKFLSQPKIFYRSGLLYSRLEYALDRERNQQMMVVGHEPDIYTIDRVAKTAKAMKDPEGAFHWPIWSYGEVPESLERLEYGMEFDFFKKVKAPQSGPVTLEKIPCDRYTFKKGIYEADLFTKLGTQTPVEIRITKGGRDEMDDFYDDYEANLPFDPSLFKVPEGIQIAKDPEDQVADWKDFSPPGGDCALKMPGTPKQPDPKMPLWESDDADQNNYAVSYYDADKPVTNIQVFFNGVMADQALSMKLKASDMKRLTYQGYPAFEFRLSGGNGADLRIRFCLAKTRLYALNLTVNTEDDPNKTVQLHIDPVQRAQDFFATLRIK